MGFTTILVLLMSCGNGLCFWEQTEPETISCGHVLDVWCTCQNDPDLSMSCLNITGDTWADFSAAMDSEYDNYTVIDTLDLSFNNLELVSEKAFGNGHIIHLDLSHNHLKSADIHANALTTHQKLDLLTLDLSYNHLTSVPESFIQELISLKHLDLTGNEKMTNLPRRSFRTLRSLEVLHVGTIILLSNGAFVGLHLGLKELEISPRPDSNFMLDLYSYFGALNLLYLENLETLIIHDGYFHLYSPFLKSFPKLMNLEMINSDISNTALLYNQADSDNVILAVNLSMNILDDVPEHFLGQLPHLEYLDLSWNDMWQVLATSFNANTKLRYLSLSHNRINNIYAGAFSSMPDLQELDLSNNELHKLYQPSFPAHFDGGIVLLLGSNQFRCYCGIWWLIDLAWRQSRGEPGPLDLYEVYNDLTCTKSNNVDKLMLFVAYDYLLEECVNN